MMIMSHFEELADWRTGGYRESRRGGPAPLPAFSYHSAGCRRSASV